MTLTSTTAATTAATDTTTRAGKKVLDVRDLRVEFHLRDGIVQAVRGVSFDVAAGETLAVVGESGCGKTVAMLSLLGLVAAPMGRVAGGSVKLQGQELLHLPERELNRVRGNRIAMIFQDPMSALNPTMRIGDQIAETLVVHRGISRSDAWRQALQLLDRTRIPAAAQRARQYPFEFSGGMLQRAMIAMSLACEPAVLIADEPTTALDVTIQNQVLELMRELQREMGMAIVLITHDLAVVARMAQRVAVMYAGRIVESGSVDDIFYRSAHPYTLGLKRALPSAEGRERDLQTIVGTPPDLIAPPAGCSFCARCDFAMQICELHDPPAFTVGDSHEALCWLQHADAADVSSDVFRGEARPR